MPLAGKGMLVNFMNVDPVLEADFNRWYDKEHVIERVAIPGFVEARRYLAVAAAQKYLALYTTETFDILTSPAYRRALQNHTPWTQRHVPNFRDVTRALARVTASEGQGRGGALAVIRIRPMGGDAGALRQVIAARFTRIVDRDGIISAHLVESDPALSRPLVETADTSGAGDWFVLIDGTDADAAARAGRDELPASALRGGELVSAGTYRLLWDLARAELKR